jgi:phytoene dehydrogenase-like protein
VGWPLPRGGSQNIANALASYFTSLGGRIVVNARIRSLAELPDGGLILCDVTPRQFAELGAGLLPAKFLRQMTGYRYGPGVFKMDWALNGPIPWRASQCRLAGTVHVGGTLDEIARSESAVWTTSAAVRPFVLVVQPTLFDSTRAPAGKHIAWAYCHVPHASEVSMTEAIENQIERFAPGFRDCIIARHSFSPREMEGHNANLVGGDITGGAQILKQILFRPTRRLYRTPLRGVYLCSSSTPPGGGVHGMCGFHAARLALQDARL